MAPEILIITRGGYYGCRILYLSVRNRHGGVRVNPKDLGTIEKKTYEFIRNSGEIQPRDVPDKRMVGAIASLKSKGLVEIYSRYTSRFRKKKKKFVRISEDVIKD
jgi:hypothetical protein